MKIKVSSILSTLAIVSVLGWASLANADVVTYSGVFTATDNFRQFSLHVGSDENVHIFTTAWSGTPDTFTGGIDSQLSLYNSDGGDLVAFADDIADDNWNSDLGSLFLNAGDYVIVLSVYDPEAPHPNLSFDFQSQDLNDIDNGTLALGNGKWDVNIETPGRDGNAVPEPGSLLLIGTGLVGVIGRVKRSL